MKTINNYEISKSQIEVWDWKESIHEEIKDYSIENGLKYILNKANNTMECPHFLGHKVKIISSFQSPPATYNR